MEQDLRDLMQEENKKEKTSLAEGHELRFLDVLENNLPKQRKTLHLSMIWKVAAGIAILLITGVSGYLLSEEQHAHRNSVLENTQMTIGSLSPELQKIETYYTANINLQLSTLSFDNESKDLVAGYMSRLQDLDAAYNNLNIELTNYGPSEATVTALIDNLKIRLELLFKLKNKLKELNTEENGRFTNETI